MADHPDASGHGEPSPLPEGEFKSSFFGNIGGGEPTSARPETLTGPPVQEPSSGQPAFPIVIGILFFLMIVGAVLLSAMKPAEPPAATAAAPTAAEPAPPPPAESVAKEADLKALSEKIASLSKEVKDLDGRLAALPKPAANADLEPLNAKVAALTKSVDTVAPLSQKVDALDERLGGLDKSLKSLQEGTASLKEQVATLRSDAKTPETTATRESAKPVDTNVEGQSLAQAVELFKAGKYKEASGVLKTTEENDPKDARVWYYAALSNGLATSNWKGDTEKFVMKGIEREKAGTPSTSEIESEFSKLPSGQKAWLDAWRKLAKQ